MQLGTVVVERRFLGPPNSANGGYACGLIGGFIGGSAEVTLRRPPPLEHAMRVVEDGSGGVALFDGDTLIGSGHAAAVSVPEIEPPSFEDAIDAAGRTFPTEAHPLPTCFVCGPLREVGDGLRIHVGPLDADDPDWSGVLAAPWVPHESLGDGEGVVRPEFVWAALDCPTAYASSSAAGMRIILLGRQALAIHRRPTIDERCVVAARQISCEGRKHFAEAVLFGAEGSLLAECRATWIEVSPEVQKGVQEGN